MLVNILLLSEEVIRGYFCHEPIYIPKLDACKGMVENVFVRFMNLTRKEAEMQLPLSLEEHDRVACSGWAKIRNYK